MSIASPDVERETLLRAIGIEARNGSIYDSLAQLFQGYEDSVTAIFREMADEERQHGNELVRRYRERYGPVVPPTQEPKEVIEAPDLEDAEAFIFDSMTVEQALQAGLRAEEMARSFYAQEVAHTSDSGLQKLYRELSEFEESHVQRLKDKLAEKRNRASSAVR
jgi:rubrerythrin